MALPQASLKQSPVTAESTIDLKLRGCNNAPPSRNSKRSKPLRPRRKSKLTRGINDLPHEIILNIITKIEFSEDNIQNIRLVSHTFNDLFVTHSASIIRDIAAQQFPIASLVMPRVTLTLQWLIGVKSSDELADEFLMTCTRRLKRYSIHFKALADPHYKKVAQVGLLVLAAEQAKTELQSPGADDELRFLPDELPNELLMCISFVSAVISQTLECVIKCRSYQDRNERFRRMSDSLLCIDSWGGIWAFLVGSTLKLDGELSKAVHRASKAWEKRFREGLEDVDLDDVQDEEEAEDLGRLDLLLKLRVEHLVGKHPTRQKLDLAVIGALQEDKVSEGAIKDLLRTMDW